jgi:hypothetical protein
MPVPVNGPGQRRDLPLPRILTTRYDRDALLRISRSGAGLTAVVA